MTLIEQIKADREKGTSGPWEVGCGDGRILALYHRPDNTKYLWDIAKTTQTSFVSDSGEYYLAGGGDKFNARRIARVPDMEEALLAADKLADAITLERDARKAYKETPNDRGGPHGTKGKARHAWLLRMAVTNTALIAFHKATGTEE